MDFNGTESSPSVSLSNATKEIGVDVVLLSEKYFGGVALTIALPAGPYFLEPSTGNIFEGKIIISTSAREPAVDITKGC